MELKDLQEIIDRNGIALKQRVGLTLSEQEAKKIIEAAVSEVFSLHVVSKSLPKYLQKCNRVEVIDQKGRSYVNWKPTNKVEISLQDDDRTVKIFITD